jgi:hypothetical protein
MLATSATSQIATGIAQRSVHYCQRARRLLAVLLPLCALGQLLIDFSSTNVLCAVLAMAVSLETYQLVLRGAVVRAAPLPALVVLGFNVATLSGALVAQTFSLRSLVFNLQVPVVTFAGCALFQASLLIALLWFVKTRVPRGIARAIAAKWVAPLGIFTQPAAVHLWLMGAIGTVVMVWSSSKLSTGGVEFGDVGGKFLQGFMYLAYAPFLIPVLKAVYPQSRSGSARSSWLLLMYFLVLVAVGMASNSRGAFAMGVANLGMALFLLILLGQQAVGQRLRRALIAGAIAILIFMPVLSDLATAMVVVRGERTSISSTALVMRTLEAFQDKAALEQYRRSTSLVGAGAYDEIYLANPFLARFVQTKFFDNTLASDAVRSGRRSDYFWEVSIDKTLAFLPTPVLRLLGTEVDKNDLAFSMGDAIASQTSGQSLGGYATGSPLGHGLALMGGFIYLAAIPLFLMAFIGLQSLTSVSNGLVVISPVMLLQLMPVFRLAVGDSLLDVAGLLLRGLIQSTVLFALIFLLVRLLTEAFGLSSPHARSNRKRLSAMRATKTVDPQRFGP